MTPPSGQLDTTPRPSPQARSVARYTGEVVYIYAFDIAYELLRKPLRTLLGQPVAQFAVDASKRSPRQVFFHRAQMVRLPPLERFGPFGPTRVERSVKLGVFVSSHGDFTDQPKVATGASELMQQVFGEAGRHARSAVGVPVLPLGVAVEVDAVVQIKS